jgi:hypothetical protein
MAVKSLLYCLVLVALCVSPALSFPSTSELEAWDAETPTSEAPVDEHEINEEEPDVQEYGNIQHSVYYQPCISEIYVIGFTTGRKHAGSNDDHHIELHTTDGKSYTAELYNRAGDDYLQNKGDLWTFTPQSFGIKSCLRKGQIDGVLFVAGGDDGWMIETAMTVYRDQNKNYNLLTVNVNFNKWLDGNSGSASRRLKLTLV